MLEGLKGSLKTSSVLCGSPLLCQGLFLRYVVLTVFVPLFVEEITALILEEVTRGSERLCTGGVPEPFLPLTHGPLGHNSHFPVLWG